MSTLSGCRELSLSVVFVLPHYQKMFIWSYMIRCWNSCPIPPSDSDGDLPLAIWHFWETPRILIGLPHISRTPCHAPWLEVFFYFRWSFSLRRFLFTEYSLWISLPFEQIIMCKQCHLKNAKLMSVLNILKMHFFIKQVNVCKTWCQLRIYRRP